MSDEELQQMDKEQLLGIIKAQRFEISILKDDKEHLGEFLKEKDEEIERLNSIIKGLDNTIENLEEVVEYEENIIKEVREYITSYESIETIQQCEHSENNKGLDEKTMIEMDRRYLIVHDKILDILDKESK